MSTIDQELQSGIRDILSSLPELNNEVAIPIVLEADEAYRAAASKALEEVGMVILIQTPNLNPSEPTTLVSSSPSIEVRANRTIAQDESGQGALAKAEEIADACCKALRWREILYWSGLMITGPVTKTVSEHHVSIDFSVTSCCVVR